MIVLALLAVGALSRAVAVGDPVIHTVTLSPLEAPEIETSDHGIVGCESGQAEVDQIMEKE